MLPLLLAPGIILAFVAAFALRWPWWGWVLTFVIAEWVTVQATKLYERREWDAWYKRQRA